MADSDSSQDRFVYIITPRKSFMDLFEEVDVSAFISTVLTPKLDYESSFGSGYSRVWKQKAISTFLEDFRKSWAGSDSPYGGIVEQLSSLSEEEGFGKFWTIDLSPDRLEIDKDWRPF